MSDWIAPELAPEKLTAGVNWWLKHHPEDAVAMTADGQDALILSGLNDVESVVWVDPEGTVRKTKVAWHTVHIEDDDEEEPLTWTRQ